MKLIIAGSREIDHRVKVERIINGVVEEHELEVTEVVCGGARGVDTIGMFWARKRKIPVKYFRAEWNKYGKRAGYKRNEQMAEYADALVAIWDGESRGTKHMIDLAEDYGLLCVVVVFVMD